jgi:hypothetical protein
MGDKICLGHRFFLLYVVLATYNLEFTMAFFKHQIANNILHLLELRDVLKNAEKMSVLCTFSIWDLLQILHA